MRDARLETFITTLDAAVAARTPQDAPVGRLQRAIFSRAAQPGETAMAGGALPSAATADLPAFVSHQLGLALDHLDTRNDDLAALGDAFRALADDLNWAPRPAGPGEVPGFRGAHANATLVGVDGLEVREDIRIGASLIAPALPYPAHHHPPEELYLVLSDGEWRNADQDWWRPGVGGVVHNPPGIEHAMRAGDGPLFAIWCLLIDATPRSATAPGR